MAACRKVVRRVLIVDMHLSLQRCNDSSRVSSFLCSGRSILFDDGELVAFLSRDMCSAYHVLIVPKQHIAGTESLVSLGDYHLLKRMMAVGRDLVAKHAPEFHGKQKMRFGFHVYPFRSIHHLHLHAMCLPFGSFSKRVRFSKFSPWYLSAQTLLKRLERKLERAPLAENMV